LTEQVADGLDGSVGDMVLAALLAVEHRDGNAPDALTADAPVAAVADHALHTVMAPDGLPVHAVDGLVDILLESIDGAEPLLGGAEDDGIVAAPAMGVLVDDVLHAHQVAGALDVLQNDLIGIPDLETGELLASLGGQAAGVVHGNDHGQLGIVLGADLKVLDAVAGRGVDTAGAAFQGDVVAQDDQTGAVQEGMLVLQHFQFGTENTGLQNGVVFNVAGFHGGLDQVGRHDVILSVDLHESVLD